MSVEKIHYEFQTHHLENKLLEYDFLKWGWLWRRPQGRDNSLDSVSSFRAQLKPTRPGETCRQGEVLSPVAHWLSDLCDTSHHLLTISPVVCNHDRDSIFIAVFQGTAQACRIQALVSFPLN
jgi:hypothetical protein